MVELIWEGKYAPDGKRAAPFRYPLPFQDVETVNEPQSVRAYNLDLFTQGRPNSDWRNRLIWGDKKYVLPSLLPEFAGKVNLIYIDPPFDTGADFSFTATIPDDPDMEGNQSSNFVKEPSMIEQKAYRDTWGRGLDGYLQWFYETVALLYELLSEDGSIYVHLDWHVGHYAKTVLDEIFSQSNFKNEIVWKRSLPHNDPKKYGATHDVLLFYNKSESYLFNQQFTGISEEYSKSHYNQVDEQGRHYQLTSLAASGAGPARRFGDRTLEPPKGTHWRYSQENIDELMRQGRIVFTSQGTPRYIRYKDEMKGPALQSIWVDINPVNSQASERVDYPTQKPEALLERIIRASSNEGDLVLDCFSGSGTTAAVAEKLGRRWITSDLGRFAIHTTRKRLLSIDGVRPFAVQNLGKYERQAWQAAEFGGSISAPAKESAARLARYRRFILDLYGAEPLEGYAWLHGLKAGRMVYVGSVDAPVTPGEVQSAGAEFWRAVGEAGAKTNGLDILGWDFAFHQNEMGKQIAAETGIDIRLKQIPREVLEKKAVQQGDIQFFELAALSVRYALEGRRLNLELIDFIVNPDDVPPDIQKAVTHWTQWVDYWAVDWDYKGDTFHNQWQHYRTKRDPRLITHVAHTYDNPGSYTVVVKVIDLLGNDTTRAITLEVP